jgi:Porin PorA
MRRVVTVLLLTLGVFAVVLGVLLRFYVHHALGVAPLDPASTTVAKGTGVTVFYPGKLTQRTDATVTATRQVRGTLVAPEVKTDGDVALWRVGLVLEDDDGTLVNATEDHVCVDRRSAMSVAKCPSQSIDQDTNVHHTGLAYKFPFNTQKQDYPFFDVTLRNSTPPMRFDGDDVVDGLPVYRFVQAIPATKVADIDNVPAELVNGTAGSTVTAGQFYQNVRTVWVEPYSGIIVKGQEEVRQTLRGPDGREGQVLLAGTLTFTQDTVRKQVADAKKARSQLQVLYDTGPLALIGLGAVFLLAGLVMLLYQRERTTTDRSRHRERRPVSVQT